MIRSTAGLTLVACVIAGTASAQPVPDPGVAVARELLSLTYPDKAMTMMQDSVVELIATASTGQFTETLKLQPTAEELARFRAAIQKAYPSVMTRAEWEQAILTVLVGAFTEAEMRALIDFHHTPLGRKLLEFQQVAPERGMKAGQDLFLRKQKEIEGALLRELTAAFPELMKPGD
jgi:hypothetical protein